VPKADVSLCSTTMTWLASNLLEPLAGAAARKTVADIHNHQPNSQNAGRNVQARLNAIEPQAAATRQTATPEGIRSLRPAKTSRAGSKVDDAA